jgi:hypothetical protein
MSEVLLRIPWTLLLAAAYFWSPNGRPFTIILNGFVDCLAAAAIFIFQTAAES